MSRKDSHVSQRVTSLEYWSDGVLGLSPPHHSTTPHPPAQRPRSILSAPTAHAAAVPLLVPGFGEHDLIALGIGAHGEVSGFLGGVLGWA